MKFISVIFFVLISINAFSASCDFFENGSKTKCDNYRKNSKVENSKKLCATGNMKVGGMDMKSVYSEKSCSSENAIAKCSPFPKYPEMNTYYYAGKGSPDFAMLEKACKVFKKAVFEKL